MSLLGNLAPNILDFPLRGDTSFVLAVVNPDGTAFNLDVTNSYAFTVAKNADDVAPLVGPLAVGSGITLLTPATAGLMKIGFSSIQAALMSAQQLYDFMLLVKDVSNNPILAQMGKLIPTLDPKSASFVTTGSSSAALSTKVLNTLTLLGEAGGVGYLDGIVTVLQDVGCVVQFLGDGINPVQWILEANSNPTVPGVTRRPLDFNASTNAKTWRRIM